MIRVSKFRRRSGHWYVRYWIGGRACDESARTKSEAQQKPTESSATSKSTPGYSQSGTLKSATPQAIIMSTFRWGRST